MKRLLYALILIFVTCSYAFCQQTDCTNIGFELGSTLGWTITSGSVTDDNQKTIYSREVAGSIENEHLITRLTDGNDPKITNEQIPMVAPGSNYSIRLGNVTRGSRFDRIQTSFLVTPDNTLFQYKFAVVLQNDTRNHESYQKPGFTVQITDQDGKELTCSFFDVQLLRTGVVEGFKTQGDIQYRNWTTGAIDLRNYIGQTLTVVVSAHGCTRQQHFGYAYFDAQCLKSEIKVTSSCPDKDGFMILKAPDGFGQYRWSNGETGTSIRVKGKLGDKYFVKLEPLSSLNASCELQLDYTIKYQKSAKEITAAICEGETFVVDDALYHSSGRYIKNISRAGICDSTVTLNLTVIPKARYKQTTYICKGEKFNVGDESFNASGTYVTTIKRPARCDSIVTTNLTVIDFNLTLQNRDSLITLGDSIQLQALILPAGDYSSSWDPPKGLACATCPVSWVKPTTTTQYTLTVNRKGVTICPQRKTVNIIVTPCSTIYVPEAFSPDNDHINDTFFVYGAKCVKQIKGMSIYNRWGDNIFLVENFPPSNPQYGWDGTYKNEAVEAGVYTYQIYIELNDGVIIKNEGVITVLR